MEGERVHLERGNKELKLKVGESLEGENLEREV